MTWRILLFVLVLSAAINIPLVAMWARHSLDPSRTPTASDGGSNSAVESSSEPPRGGPPSPETILREIGVTDAQWEKMKERHDAFQQSMWDSHEKFRRLNIELLNLVAASEADRESIQEKQDRIAELQRGIQGLIVENLLADKRDLTDDQQKRLFDRLRRFFPPDKRAPADETGPARELSPKVNPNAEGTEPVADSKTSEERN